MRLFIVSQNKKQIKKLTDSIEIKDNIQFNPNNPNGIEQPKYISSSIFVDGINFGTYNSQEEAIKIVQEIKQEFSKSVEPKSKPSLKAKEIKDNALSNGNEPYIKGLDVDSVYEMPQNTSCDCDISPRKHESPPTQ